MLDDYNSRIPVMGEASRVRAVLAGQATRRPELILHPYQLQSPRLDYIVGASNLREGERVITSGDGGLYPRGIPVGVARREGDGQWRVALAAAQRPIDFVRLIPFIGVAPPEAAPVEDSGPPLAAASSVSVIGRETMAPAPAAPSQTMGSTPRAPRREPSAPASPAPAQAAPPVTPPAGTPTPEPASPAPEEGAAPAPAEAQQ
jgi:rod shape-determining protein MreC